MDIEIREVKESDARDLMNFLVAVGDETDNLSFSGAGFKLDEESEARFIKRFKSIFVLRLAESFLERFKIFNLV